VEESDMPGKANSPVKGSRTSEDGDGHATDAARDAHELCVALLQPRDPEEMRAMLADLCTPGEIRSLAERWRVARLLDEGALSYRDIHDATGVSTTTITRVARFLRDEAYGGYRLAIERLKGTGHGTRKSTASGRGSKIG
jgi:TrpR-related protein YerC/YecD